MATTTNNMSRPTNTSMGQLHLFHIISPALPVGAFSYSQGLEYAIDADWIDKDSLQPWLEAQLAFSLTRTELPLLIRCYQAYQHRNWSDFHHWSEFLLSSRETKELRQQEQQLAWALRRLLNNLKLSLQLPPETKQSYLALYAAYVVHHEIDLHPAALGWLWNWLENQIAAASKLFPLGQTDAQTILYQLVPALEQAWQQAQSIEDVQLGVTLPAASMASARHETQYSRLFRS